MYHGTAFLSTGFYMGFRNGRTNPSTVAIATIPTRIFQIFSRVFFFIHDKLIVFEGL